MTSRFVLSVWIKETNKKALSGGFVEFKQKGADAGESTSASSSLQSDAVFAMMNDRISPEIISRVKGVFKFEIKQDGKGKLHDTLTKLFNVQSCQNMDGRPQKWRWISV